MQAEKQLEQRLKGLKAGFDFPPTPDVAGRVEWDALRSTRSRATRRRLVGVGLAALVLLVSLFSVPSVRARILEFLQVGAVRVLLEGEPQPTMNSIPGSLRDALAGETTLETARAEAGFPIRLPTYPPGLGPPDRVYLQDLGGRVVLLLWLDLNDPDEVQVSLQMLGPGAWATKSPPRSVEETEVNGRPALWTQGPYMLQFAHQDGTRSYGDANLVEGNVLIWEEDGVTYRLEAGASLSEAVQIAESLSE